MPKARLIILTGINGAGKDTLAPLVAGLLDGVGDLPAQFIYAPTVTSSSTAFRSAILDGKPQSPFAEFLGYMAQHAESAHYIADLLRRKPQHLVINRGPETALVYNAIGNQLPAAQMRIARRIYPEIAAILQPTNTVLLDVSLEVSRQRAAQQPETDHIQDRGDDYFLRMIRAYRALAKANPAIWSTVDASQSVEQVLAQIRHNVLRLPTNAN